MSNVSSTVGAWDERSLDNVTQSGLHPTAIFTRAYLFLSLPGHYKDCTVEHLSIGSFESGLTGCWKSVAYSEFYAC